MVGVKGYCPSADMQAEGGSTGTQKGNPMDAGMVTAICTGAAVIIAAASPVVIEVLRQRRSPEDGEKTQPPSER